MAETLAGTSDGKEITAAAAAACLNTSRRERVWACIVGILSSWLEGLSIDPGVHYSIKDAYPPYSRFDRTLRFFAAALPTAAADRTFPLQDNVVEGRFGAALDADQAAAESARPLPAYKAFPLTVECWCRLDDSAGYNILAANKAKDSADHWELYTEDRTGTLSAYLPGFAPSIIKSPVAITDRRWHYVAMVVNGNRVVLYVNGREAVASGIARIPGGKVIGGPFCVGKAVFAGGEIGCRGVIDDVRLSCVERELHGVPRAPLAADASTVGLWNFDLAAGATEFADASANANPLRVPRHRSLSAADRESYKAGPAPLDVMGEPTPLADGAVELPPLAPTVSLDGPWQLVEGGTNEQRLTGPWDRAMTAAVPGSVHTALYRAGVIPFPFFGRNQEIARPWSFKTYWYKKNFARPPQGQERTLVFHGVCNRCTIWLNGKKLGSQEGMFTRREFPVRGLLQAENTLVVKLDPAINWTKTVVFNNSYGWHYSKFPPLGIWRSVEIRGEPDVRIADPLVATRDAPAGLVDLLVTLAAPRGNWAGKLVGVVSPENFRGRALHFTRAVHSAAAEQTVHLAMAVPNPRLWHPVGMGDPNLYRLKLAFLPEGGGKPDLCEITFGIRTVQMAPVAGRANPRSSIGPLSSTGSRCLSRARAGVRAMR